MTRVPRVRVLSWDLANFGAWGNRTVRVELDGPGIVLVVGDDNRGGRNAVGKSALVNALYHALFGESPIPGQRVGSLVNALNAEGLRTGVTLLTSRGTLFEIQRGRKPDFVSWRHVDDSGRVLERGNEGNDALAEAVTRAVGANAYLFSRLCFSSTTMRPFFELSGPERRDWLAALLGIDTLASRSALLKERLRAWKLDRAAEAARIETEAAARRKIENLVADLERRAETWERQRRNRLREIDDAIAELSGLDPEEEVALHEARQLLSGLEEQLSRLESRRAEIERRLAAARRRAGQARRELSALDELVCPHCGGSLASDDLRKTWQRQLDDARAEREELEAEAAEISAAIDSLEGDLGQLRELPDPSTASVEEARDLARTIGKLQQEREELAGSPNSWLEEAEKARSELLPTPELSDGTLAELDFRIEVAETLKKLLENPKSPLRARLVENAAEWITERTNGYLERLGARFRIEFAADMRASVLHSGTEMDYPSLSRGERVRTDLALTMAMREWYESLHGTLGIWIIDEVLDSGIDQEGALAAWSLLEEDCERSGRTIVVVSHREEFFTRARRILTVRRKGAFPELLDSSRTA